VALTRGSNADMPSQVYFDGESQALENPLTGVAND
jgi:hypothetical protein